MKYKKGYKYILAEDYRIFLGIADEVENPFIKINNGILTIKSGYAWDGATGAIDTKNFMRGSLVHDALYQLIGEEKFSDRKFADDTLRKICREDGMSSFRAYYVWKAVRLLGSKFIRRKKVYNISL